MWKVPLSAVIKKEEPVKEKDSIAEVVAAVAKSEKKQKGEKKQKEPSPKVLPEQRTTPERARPAAKKVSYKPKPAVSTPESRPAVALEHSVVAPPVSESVEVPEMEDPSTTVRAASRPETSRFTTEYGRIAAIGSAPSSIQGVVQSQSESFVQQQAQGPEAPQQQQYVQPQSSMLSFCFLC
jgi:hypothetical protein